MQKTFHKYKLLLDENMPRRSIFPRLNELFDVKHIRDDLKSGGLSDPQVYMLAVKQKRFLVTYNIKDFEELATHSQDIGIIGVSANLPPYQVDTKLTSLFTRSSAKSLLGRLTSITGET